MKQIKYEIRSYFKYGGFEVRTSLDKIPTEKEFEGWCSWVANWKLVKVTTFTTDIKPLKEAEN